MGLEHSEAVATIVLTVAYNGAEFSGFARQVSVRTVQGELEDALATAMRRPIVIACAGRTDAGVHALGQTVSFAVGEGECDTDESMHRLRRTLNALTGDDISVRTVHRAAADFSARFSALQRTYRYRISLESARPIFCAPYVYHLGRPLDQARLEQAAQYLIGEHDFRSFCVTASATLLTDLGLSTHRDVRSLSVFEEKILGETVLTIEVVGNAFLHSMVRTMVGTLVEVGLGKQPPEWVAEVLAARNRAQAGPTAPACGLTLHRVDYPEDILA